MVLIVVKMIPERIWRQRASAHFKVLIKYFSVTGGELFEDIVAREFYSEADAR